MEAKLHRNMDDEVFIQSCENRLLPAFREEYREKAVVLLRDTPAYHNGMVAHGKSPLKATTDVSAVLWCGPIENAWEPNIEPCCSDSGSSQHPFRPGSFLHPLSTYLGDSLSLLQQNLQLYRVTNLTQTRDCRKEATNDCFGVSHGL